MALLLPVSLVGCNLLPSPTKPSTPTTIQGVEALKPVGLSSESAVSGPIFGVVVDGAGNPAKDVKVVAFLNNSSPMVGNSGAGRHSDSRADRGADESRYGGSALQPRLLRWSWSSCWH